MYQQVLLTISKTNTDYYSKTHVQYLINNTLFGIYALVIGFDTGTKLLQFLIKEKASPSMTFHKMQRGINQ